MVASLETFKGCTIKIVTKGSGFNGLSTSLSGKVRKIELKTVKKSDDWFAINGLAGIEKLFFDDLYWLYFSVIPENYVIVTSSDQWEKADRMLSAYEQVCRHNDRHGENRTFVNFVDGGGWLARKRDLERLVEHCHYFINLQHLDMLESIVLQHVPEKYLTRKPA